MMFEIAARYGVTAWMHKSRRWIARSMCSLILSYRIRPGNAAEVRSWSPLSERTSKGACQAALRQQY
jgi:hypothetical protein